MVNKRAVVTKKVVNNHSIYYLVPEKQGNGNFSIFNWVASASSRIAISLKAKKLNYSIVGEFIKGEI